MKLKDISCLLMVLGAVTFLSQASGQTCGSRENTKMNQNQSLSQRQQGIITVAALAASGDLTLLKNALNKALDGGMTINDGKEVLVQVYAYAGFPRSLNALDTFMNLLTERHEQGIEDVQGKTVRAPIPKGDALLEQGIANQTELAGGPVQGPLFDFVPAIDKYLKTHLFGDIFSRDNLNWQDRELATLAMLSVLTGAEAQLLAHIGIAKNTGLTVRQLEQLVKVLEKNVGRQASARTDSALTQYLTP